MDPEELRMKIGLLPPELQQYVLDLPLDKQQEVIEQIIQATELSFRQLEEEDIALIQERTGENGAYGFVSEDIQMSWSEVGSENYISLGAFDERAGLEVPVAFIIAEVSSLEKTKGEYIEDDASPSTSGLSSDDGTDGGAAASSTASAEVYSLLKDCGMKPSDTLLSIYFLGVDYEFRRQGFGTQLMELVRGIAEEARAKMMWLNVAEHNPDAISFYSNYGFKVLKTVPLGSIGTQAIMTYALESPASAAPLLGEPSNRKSKRAKAKGSSRAPSSKGFGKPRAMLIPTASYTASCAATATLSRTAPQASWGRHRLDSPSSQGRNLVTSQTSGLPSSRMSRAMTVVRASTGHVKGAPPNRAACARHYM